MDWAVKAYSLRNSDISGSRLLFRKYTILIGSKQLKTVKFSIAIFMVQMFNVLIPQPCQINCRISLLVLIRPLSTCRVHWLSNDKVCLAVCTAAFLVFHFETYEPVDKNVTFVSAVYLVIFHFSTWQYGVCKVSLTWPYVKSY